MDRIQRMDNKILDAIQRRMRCRFLDIVMPAVSVSANLGAVWLAVIVAFIVSERYRRNGFILAGMLALCIIVGNFGLKPYAARLRPCHEDPDHPLLIRRPLDYSFPSCHTLAAFACAMAIFWANPFFGFCAFVYAVLIAFSRMYLFVHYPSDVFAAMIIGVTMPWSAVVLLIRLRRREKKPRVI